VTLLPGASIVDQATSFGLLRGGQVDIGIVEASQVSENGDLVGPLEVGGGMGSHAAATDVAEGAKLVIAMMEHTTRNRSPRIVTKTDYPVAARGCVDLIFTDVAVIQVTPQGLVVRELARGWNLADVQAITDPHLSPAPDLGYISFWMMGGELPSKVWKSGPEAVADMPDGATVLMDGFAGPGGMAQYLIHSLREQGARDLTLVSNTAGIANVASFGTPAGFLTIDHSLLVESGQVRKAIASYPVSPRPSQPSAFELAYKRGEAELELVPQGTLAERIRAGAFGIAAFFTPTGVGTPLAEGKETRTFNGREYVLEQGIRADYALIRAHKADTLGNLVYKGTSRNFNAVMAPAAKITIAEVDEVVEPGMLDPDAVVTPGVFVQRVVQRPADFQPYEPMKR
jgi:3-oxoacid CoA-transferase A subunit